MINKAVCVCCSGKGVVLFPNNPGPIKARRCPACTPHAEPEPYVDIWTKEGQAQERIVELELGIEKALEALGTWPPESREYKCEKILKALLGKKK